MALQEARSKPVSRSEEDVEKITSESSTTFPINTGPAALSNESGWGWDEAVIGTAGQAADELSTFPAQESGEAAQWNPRSSDSRHSQINRDIESYLSHKNTLSRPAARDNREARQPAQLPEQFDKLIEEKHKNDKYDEDVLQYYRDLGRRDSTRIPGPFGERSIVDGILHYDEMTTVDWGSARWLYVRSLGSGGYGEVELWEKPRRSGPPLRLAVKNTVVDNFFLDYNSEGNIIRRLNDAGCKNVVKVLDWCYDAHPTQPSFARWRICFEYAELGDLYSVQKWYREHSLIIPESFVWHVFHSLANALYFFRYGTNDTTSIEVGLAWDRIVHGDLKPENVLMTSSDPSDHMLYPCLKVIDFGLAYTLGEPLRKVARFKSTFRYGTFGYRAPEVVSALDRDLTEDEFHGSHVDVFSLGIILAKMVGLADKHVKTPGVLTRSLQKEYPLDKGPTYYSPVLLALINRCRAQIVKDRPTVDELYTTTKEMARIFRERAYQEQRQVHDSMAEGGCFHSQMLFTKDEKTLFETNQQFRTHYQDANLVPLYTAQPQTPILVAVPIAEEESEEKHADASPGGPKANDDQWGGPAIIPSEHAHQPSSQPASATPPLPASDPYAPSASDGHAPSLRTSGIVLSARARRSRRSSYRSARERQLRAARRNIAVVNVFDRDAVARAETRREGRW